jgi:hypothetical protein
MTLILDTTHLREERRSASLVPSAHGWGQSPSGSRPYHRVNVGHKGWPPTPEVS